MKSQFPNPKLEHSRRWIGCLAALVLLSAGCRASNHHYATSLPDQYEVHPQENAQTVDLSKLAVKGASNEYIDNGDVLEVTIAAGLNRDDLSTQQARVNDEGNLRLPLLGDVQVAGLDLEGAEQAISNECIQKGLYRMPTVTVTMKRQRMNKITVVGAVKKPGVYELPRGNCDLLSAIVEAGGLTEEAGTNVEIRQPGTINSKTEADSVAKHTIGQKTQTVGYTPSRIKRTNQSEPAKNEPAEVTDSKEPSLPGSVRINLISAAKEGNGGGFIQDGGVVNVEKRDPTPLTIVGLVRKPDRYKYPIGQDVRVMDAIGIAGGTSSKVADKVIVTRPQGKDGRTDPVVIQVSIAEAKRKGSANLLLAPGDVVSVEPTPSTVLLDAVEIVRFGIGATLF